MKQPDEKFKICVIDDDAVYLNLLIKILKVSELNAEIRSFANGNTFLEKLSADNYLPDLCLIDISLEIGMSGYNISRYLKQNKKYRDIAVIFITGYNDEESISQAYECGASDYITKPFNKVELINRIKTQLNLKETLNELKTANYSLRKLNQKYKYELRLARNVQRSIMMDADIKNDFFETAYIFKPHFNLGGDYIDAARIRDQRYALMIGDMAGHGVAIALKVALIKSFISTHVFSQTSPAAFMRKLNLFLLENLQNIELNYLSLFLGIYDTKNRNFIYSSAGLPFMLYFNSANNSLEDFGVKGCPLGIIRNSEFQEYSTVINPKDKLILFSDGLFDIQDNSGNYLVIENIKKFLLTDELIMRSVDIIKDKLNEYLIFFKGQETDEEDFNDDISVMFVSFK